MSRIRPGTRVGCCGTFDYQLHPGHKILLRFARKQGSWLFVFVVPDVVVQHRKGRKPYYTQRIRTRNVESLEYVNEAIALEGNGESSLRSQILSFGLDVYVFGPDQVSPWDMALEQSLAQLGTEIVRCPHRKRFSTTKILRKKGLLHS